MTTAIAELLGERKKLDAKIKRAVAEAFPAGSRQEFRDRFGRTRRGPVVVTECRGEFVWVNWSNERDNYDARRPVWGASTVGKAFSAEPRELTPVSASPE